MSATVDIRKGSIYLSASVVETYFQDIGAVIILIEEGDVLVLPVHQMAAGGCLLKIKNLAGDRVAMAPDVFHANGLGDFSAAGLEATWSRERGALKISIPKTAN